ncbi:DNA polymerase III subunit gamma/tau [Candidatus Peregrinibacteria bacterium]|nr:DNA polymerase III subunit gamma/tau [Candidatus Peregrinibacteria bacterium]
MSLYRKYRPKDFPSLIGQEHIRITLLNAIKESQIAHAYLFTGPRGTGKTTTARLLAKAINAEKMSEDGRFDGSEIAEEIDAGRLIDVIEIDAASNRGIDEIRELREKISYAPTRAKNKVYIIDEVHMLTKEAFNALLKTLEEPPAFVYFILATTEINKVPETIISRCQRFDFRRITDQDILGRLQFVASEEGILAEEEALKMIAKQSRGGLRDALSLLEQLISGKKVEAEKVKKVLGISNALAAEKMYGLIEKGDASEAVKELQIIFAQGVDLIQFNKEVLDFLRHKLVEKVNAADQHGAAKIIDLIGNFQEAYEKHKFSYIPELPLEVAIVKSCLKAGLTPSKAAPVQIESEMDGSKKKPELAKVENSSRIETTEIIAEVTSPVAEIAVTKEAVTVSAGEISFEELLNKWTGVFDRIQNPLAKRCLMAGKPVGLEGNNVILSFSSNFNKDKLFVPELLAMCEKAIEDELKAHLKLSGKVDLAMAQQNEAKSAAMDVDRAEGNVPSATIDSALSVFGGELIGD